MVLSCWDFVLVPRNISSYIASSYACGVSSIVLSIPTTILNLTYIVAVLKSNERTEPCQILLLNLAFTDLFTGIFSLPSHFIEAVYAATLKSPCSFANVTTCLKMILGLVSFITITIIAVERYTCIFYPYIHNARVTSFFLSILVTGVWFVSTAVYIAFYFFTTSKVFFLTNLVFCVFASIVIVFSYVKILLRARGIRQEIEANLQRFGQHRITEKDKNLLLVGGFIILSHFLCFSPFFAYGIFVIIGNSSNIQRYMPCWKWVFIMASSFFNPIISCTFNPAVKRKVIKMWTCGRKGDD